MRDTKIATKTRHDLAHHAVSKPHSNYINRSQYNMNSESEAIVIYRPENTDLEISIRADAAHRAVWGTQRQIAQLLDLDVRTVNEHIQNFKEQRGERANQVIRKFRITASDGKSYDVEHYDLTVITYVGFRAQCSERVMAFQDWVGEQLDQLGGDRRLMTPAEQLLESAKQLVEHERAIAAVQVEQAEHDRRISTLERVVKNNQEFYTVKGYYSLRRMGSVSDVEARKIGQRAAKISREQHVVIEQIPNSEWGKLNAYHVSILDEITGFKPVR
jgi:hypothetical protein